MRHRLHLSIAFGTFLLLTLLLLPLPFASRANAQAPTGGETEVTNPDEQGGVTSTTGGTPSGPKSVRGRSSALRGLGPAISLNKTVGIDPAICATSDEVAIASGTEAIYCYRVTNNGSITLTRHDLEDSELGPLLSDFPFALAPGASAFVTQSTVITVPTVNSAIWTAFNPGPTDVVTASDTATVTLLAPSISLDKRVGTDASLCAVTDEIAVPAGTVVTYCYQVTNTGAVTLTRHDLEDSELGALLTDFPFVLVPGASAFLTQSATINTTTVNVANWTAYNPGPTSVVSASDAATVTVLGPSITLDKTVGTDSALCAAADEISVPAGTEVTYCYEVTNTGAVTLTRHDLEDSELGPLLTDFPFVLVPGASAFLTATATITETTINIADWTAYNSGPSDVVSATDAATVTILAPSIILEKTVGTDSAQCALTDEISVLAGTDVTYCYEVTNNGPVTLTQHDLTDSELGAILTDFPYALAPGASAFLTQTTTINTTTVNTATWEASNPGPLDVVSASDVATVTIIPNAPAITLDKTVGTDHTVCATTDAITVTAGTDVTYCYEVTNTGNITLTQHDLTDSELGAILTSFPYALAPGASAFLTETTTINTTTVNTATWEAYNPGPVDEASATDAATVTVLEVGVPSVTLDKGVGLDPSVCATSELITVTIGTAVTYCYRVTNTGNVTLTRHNLDDSELGTLLTGHAFDLAPGASTYITQSATISETTVNTATWTAYNDDPADGAAASDSATVVAQAPTAISLGLFHAERNAAPARQGWLVAALGLLTAGFVIHHRRHG